MVTYPRHLRLAGLICCSLGGNSCALAALLLLLVHPLLLLWSTMTDVFYRTNRLAGCRYARRAELLFSSKCVYDELATKLAAVDFLFLRISRSFVPLFSVSVGCTNSDVWYAIPHVWPRIAHVFLCMFFIPLWIMIRPQNIVVRDWRLTATHTSNTLPTQNQ